VLGADVGVVERLGLLRGEREHLLHARRVGDVAHLLEVRPRVGKLLHLLTDGFEVEPHLLEDVHGDALAELDEAEEQVLRADEIVVEPVRFLPREGQHLLRARGEIAHLIAHGAKLQRARRFVQFSIGKFWRWLK